MIGYFASLILLNVHIRLLPIAAVLRKRVSVFLVSHNSTFFPGYFVLIAYEYE